MDGTNMRFKKLYTLPLMLGISATSLYAKAAKPELAAPAHTSPDINSLMVQIEALKAEVATIAHKQKEEAVKAAHQYKVMSAKNEVAQAKTLAIYPDGFFAIPGTNSAIRFGGRIAVDSQYSGGPVIDTSGASFTAPSIPIKGASPAASKSGHFGATAQSSRFTVEGLSQTVNGDITSRLEFDFFGAQNGAIFSTGNGGLTTTNAYKTSNSVDYGLRVRQAYIQFVRFTVGQLETNFIEKEASTSSIDTSGVSAAPRRAQVRWSPQIAEGVELNLSIEKGNSDYVFSEGSVRGNETFGKTPLPDFTGRFKYKGEMGYISVSSIVRSLAVNAVKGEAVNATGGNSNTIVNSFSARRTGWGLGLGFHLNVSGDKSGLYGLLTIGEGLGFLNQDGNPAAYFSTPLSSQTSENAKARYANEYSLTRSTYGMLGYKHYWAPNIRSTLFGTYMRIKNPANAPVMNGATQINARVKRIGINTVYSPESLSSLDFGVEFNHGVRETISGYVASSTAGATSTYYGGGTGRASTVNMSVVYRLGGKQSKG